jgi:site-specific DNA-cytosine methylase
VAFVKAQRAHDPGDHERWERGVVAPTMDSAGHAPRTPTAVVAATLNSGGNAGGFRTEPGERLVTGHFPPAPDPLLPPGLDSRRYKAIGNGVVAPVAEWIGRRLLAYLEGPLA